MRKECHFFVKLESIFYINHQVEHGEKKVLGISIENPDSPQAKGELILGALDEVKFSDMSWCDNIKSEQWIFKMNQINFSEKNLCENCHVGVDFLTPYIQGQVTITSKRGHFKNGSPRQMRHFEIDQLENK